MAVICVELTTVTFVAAVPPKLTVAPERKPPPWMVMTVPGDPLSGVTLLMP